ncbi:hypothetical protein B0H65DRAFT_29319 [Neurospora tetraspora]|uniref:Uncharacterized protein n=1 Tax=Neurospora tetraspora TaxID=94610 RepID=A0AAE0JNQ5_9PEZI|nr:hypothetical protein B0H65DRAFT_29319 [Neurospora tetraspora]
MCLTYLVTTRGGETSYPNQQGHQKRGKEHHDGSLTDQEITKSRKSTAESREGTKILPLLPHSPISFPSYDLHGGHQVRGYRHGPGPEGGTEKGNFSTRRMKTPEVKVLLATNQPTPSKTATPLCSLRERDAKEGLDIRRESFSGIEHNSTVVKYRKSVCLTRKHTQIQMLVSLSCYQDSGRSTQRIKGAAQRAVGSGNTRKTRETDKWQLDMTYVIKLGS